MQARESISRQLASPNEWDYAKACIEEMKSEKTLSSGVKLNHKEHAQLHHSFLYLSDKQKNTLVCLAKHYYLGQGSYGTVKLAEDEHGQLYALKILGTPIKKTEKNILRLLNQFQFVGKQRTINPSQPLLEKQYLLLRLVPGVTLADYLLTATTTHKQKQALAYHLILALIDLHKHNIIHGDIKPDNIMIHVDENGIPFIYFIDFNGSYLLIGDETEYRGEIIGASGYLAPEAKARDSIKLTLASDIYSLAVLLQKDLGLSDDILMHMRGEHLLTRTTLKNAAQTFVSFAEIPLAEPNLSQRLICRYKEKLQDLATQLTKKIALADLVIDGKLLQNKPFAWDSVEASDEAFEHLAPAIHSETKLSLIINELAIKNERCKNKFTRLNLKGMKAVLISVIQELVRKTDNIDELYALLNAIKKEEAADPILTRLRFPKFSEMTHSWKMTLRIFQTRALEIAYEKSRSNKLSSVKPYNQIFAEYPQRFFTNAFKKLTVELPHTPSISRPR